MHQVQDGDKFDKEINKIRLKRKINPCSVVCSKSVTKQYFAIGKILCSVYLFTAIAEAESCSNVTFLRKFFSQRVFLKNFLRNSICSWKFYEKSAYLILCPYSTYFLNAQMRNLYQSFLLFAIVSIFIPNVCFFAPKEDPSKKKRRCHKK